MNTQDMVAAAREHGGPLFVVHGEHVAAELARLRDAFVPVYRQTRLAYSVKTNYLPTLIRRAHQDGHLIEVVSAHEWQYARSLGVPDADIVLNGPVKSADTLRAALDAGVTVNLDSLAEVDLVEEMAATSGTVRVGVRVAPLLPNGRRSRFGIDPTLLVERVRPLIESGSLEVPGLHLHYSMDREATSYADRVELLSQVARDLGIRPDYLDIGGGQASALPPSVKAQLGYDVSTFEEYAAAAGGAMRRLWGAEGPTLILEPGTATLSGAMSYVCSVVSSRPGEGVAVVDGTMFETNPLRSRIIPPIEVASERTRTGGRTSVYGATCMEIDVLGEVDGDLEPGDVLIVGNVGAYSLVLSPEFIVPSRRGDR